MKLVHYFQLIRRYIFLSKSHTVNGQNNHKYNTIYRPLTWDYERLVDYS